jgi:hypothetical protein
VSDLGRRWWPTPWPAWRHCTTIPEGRRAGALGPDEAQVSFGTLARNHRGPRDPPHLHPCHLATVPAICRSTWLHPQFSGQRLHRKLDARRPGGAYRRGRKSITGRESMSALEHLSEALASAVQLAGEGVVRVEGRRRIPSSGIVWDADGLVITAHHTIDRRSEVRIGLPSGKRRRPSSWVGILRQTWPFCGCPPRAFACQIGRTQDR